MDLPIAERRDVPDRADAAHALGDVKGNDAVAAALGDAAVARPFLGRAQRSAPALGRIGGADAENRVLAA